MTDLRDHLVAELAELVAIQSVSPSGSVTQFQYSVALAQGPTRAHWESNWGDVRIENVQQQRDGTYHFYISWFGLAESGRSEPVGGNSYAPGIYNPKNGQMSFRYLQTSFNGADRGTASLTASVNGRIVRLSGSYQHDSGRRGYWQMAEETVCLPWHETRTS